MSCTSVAGTMIASEWPDPTGDQFLDFDAHAAPLVSKF